MRESATTGTVYALTDPRDNEPRYIGATTQTLPQRLRGHLGGKAAPKVRAWVTELRAAGLRPEIIPICEDVPAGDLLVAETAEITRIIAAGGTLLNEQVTALGRKLLRERQEAEREAAEHAGWAELATVAMDVFGGPLPPGDLPLIDIPDRSWAFMSAVRPGHDERMRSLIDTDYQEWRYLHHEQEQATRELWWAVQSAWGHARGLADDFDIRLERYTDTVAETPCSSRAEAARHLGLIVWYMVAVEPWRHLAEIAGLMPDDASFIAWAGRDEGVRDALEFLAARREGNLRLLAGNWERDRWREPGPGRMLATVAAAYTGTVPGAAIRADVVTMLTVLASHHQMTQPLADLMMHLDPEALDTVFGPDIAAELDVDLCLPAGTSGRVLRALLERDGTCGHDRVRLIADRSAQVLPVTALPDFGGYQSGPTMTAARVISTYLVRDGRAASEYMTAEEYLTDVRSLWVPDPWERRHAA